MNHAFTLLALTSFVMLGFREPSDKTMLRKTEIMKEYIVRKSIAIKAEPSQVWDALTNPERTKNYFFHSKVYSDWQAGSDITFKGRIFLVKKIELKGKIIKVEPNKLLQYDLKNGSEKDEAAGKSVVTDELTYENGVTTVTISDNVGSGEEAEKRFKRSQKGWDKILAGLKKEVEEQK